MQALGNGCYCGSELVQTVLKDELHETVTVCKRDLTNKETVREERCELEPDRKARIMNMSQTTAPPRSVSSIIVIKYLTTSLLLA